MPITAEGGEPCFFKNYYSNYSFFFFFFFLKYCYYYYPHRGATPVSLAGICIHLNYSVMDFLGLYFLHLALIGKLCAKAAELVRDECGELLGTLAAERRAV